VVFLDERVDEERNVAGDVSGEDMTIYRTTTAETAGILGGRKWAREEWREKRAGGKERGKMAGMLEEKLVGSCADGLAVGPYSGKRCRLTPFATC
jgi:hypothetical protein